METRIRSPDDPPYATIEDDCVYWKTAEDLEQDDLNRLRFLTVLRENVFMVLVGSMSNPSLNHCCAWKCEPAWGGFNAKWALMGAVLDVSSPFIDGTFYETYASALRARKKLLDPVGYQAGLDRANAQYAAKKEADPIGHRAKLDDRNAKAAAKKVLDPVGYQAGRDRKSAQWAVKNAADPDGYRAKLDENNAQYAANKAADPIGHRAKLDARNAKSRATYAAKKAVDPTGFRAMRDEKNAAARGKRKAAEESPETKSNRSISEFFSKRTKTGTESEDVGTELGTSPYFAKK